MNPPWLWHFDAIGQIAPFYPEFHGIPQSAQALQLLDFSHTTGPTLNNHTDPMQFAMPEPVMPPEQHPAPGSAQHRERSQALVVGGVVVAHLVVLLWIGRQVHIAPPTVIAPSVVGVLIAPEPAPAPPAPKPLEPAKPKPKPVVTERPKAVTPQPAALPAAPAPTPVVPTPVQAQTQTQAQAQTVSPSVTPNATNAPPAPDTQAVTPPRTDAAHLNNPPPAYPALSRRLGEQGRVLVDVYILPDGSVGDLKLNKSSGFARLDDAAMTAVKKWKYVPAKRGNQPIAFWYVQPVSFVLNSN
ncbi:MAG TPA: energy transducer TonB [Limnobacter sp.]|uniref:energy transducer TonB n=1 Tax=Limnobacter sp. TaxID=2003368 RepID=UPI002EDA6725